MLLYSEIDIDWLNDFLTLTSYEEQLTAVKELLDDSVFDDNGVSVLLTLTTCSIYAPYLNRQDNLLPPIAAWWLDPRSQKYREQVITHLQEQHCLHTRVEQLDFIASLSIAPRTQRNDNGLQVVNEFSSTNDLKNALNAFMVAKTVQTWIPELAPEILHCLSPLWNREYTIIGEGMQGIQTLKTYDNALDFFSNDPVAQRMLVYLGHKPEYKKYPQLHELYMALLQDPPAPWSVYQSLGLKPNEILQAEYAREVGMTQLSVEGLVLNPEGVQP